MAVTVFPTPSTGGAAKTEKIDIITSTGTWTSPAGVTKVDVLLVGGGGGGGGAGAVNHMGGGGGGGGVIQQTLSISESTAYTITIGAGGSAGTYSNSSPGGNGSNSTFGSLLTALGGGGGWSSFGVRPAQGTFGSGGGQGYNVGGSNSGSGGGASTFFVPNTNTGSSTQYSAQFSQGVFVNQGTFGYTFNTLFFPGNPGINGYGSGGGGASTSTITAQRIPGGLNAGIGAIETTAATAGAANFGGGGGGGTSTNVDTPRLAGAGGSGVCIIRYWS